MSCGGLFMTGQPSLTHGIVSLCLQAPRQHKPGVHRQQASCGCSCEHAQHRAAAAEHPVAGATGPLQRPLGELLITSRIFLAGTLAPAGRLQLQLPVRTAWRRCCRGTSGGRRCTTAASHLASSWCLNAFLAGTPTTAYIRVP